MPRRYFVLDASALAFRYIASKDLESQSIRRRLDRLFLARAANPESIILQVPDICMAECSKAFARACFEKNLFGSGERARDAYLRLRDGLLRDVRDDRIIHSLAAEKNPRKNRRPGQ